MSDNNKKDPSRQEEEKKDKKQDDKKTSDEQVRGGENAQQPPSEEEVPPATYPRIQPDQQPNPEHIIGGGRQPVRPTDYPPLSERPPGFEDEYEISRSLRDNQPSSFGYPRIPAVGQDDLNPPGLGGGPPYPMSNVPPNPLSDDRRQPGSSSGMIPGPDHPIFGGGPQHPSLPGMGPSHPRGARFDPTGAPLDEFTDPEGLQNNQQPSSRLGPFGNGGPSNPFGGFGGGGFGGGGGGGGFM